MYIRQSRGHAMTKCPPTPKITISSPPCWLFWSPPCSLFWSPPCWWCSLWPPSYHDRHRLGLPASVIINKMILIINQMTIILISIIIKGTINTLALASLAASASAAIALWSCTGSRQSLLSGRTRIFQKEYFLLSKDRKGIFQKVDTKPILIEVGKTSSCKWSKMTFTFKMIRYL